MCMPPNPMRELELKLASERVLRHKAELLYPPLPPLQSLIETQRARARTAELSEADQKRLAGIRARQAARTAKYERRQALKPSALFSRLKARAARVTWDSWG